MTKRFAFFLGGLLAGALTMYAFLYPAWEKGPSAQPVQASQPAPTNPTGSDTPDPSAVPDDDPDLARKYRELLAEYGRINRYLSTEEDLPLYIIAEQAGARREIVVYSKLPPMNHDAERKVYILRLVNQVLRDRKDADRITIWDDEAVARQYARGEYSNRNTITGWAGFDRRAAWVVKDQNGLFVRYALGRDDFENISFGMRIPVY